MRKPPRNTLLSTAGMKELEDPDMGFMADLQAHRKAMHTKLNKAEQAAGGVLGLGFGV